MTTTTPRVGDVVRHTYDHSTGRRTVTGTIDRLDRGHALVDFAAEGFAYLKLADLEVVRDDFPVGASVAFTWRGMRLEGTVVDHLQFNGKVRHGVLVDDRTYDVWPDMGIEAVRSSIAQRAADTAERDRATGGGAGYPVG